MTFAILPIKSFPQAKSRTELDAGSRAELAESMASRVLRALEQVRARVAAGAHAAGWLAYEAGHAFDPKLTASARQSDGPLLAFGLYDGFETPDLAALLPPPEGAFAGHPQPRIERADYEAAVAEVRESGVKKALDQMTPFERKVVHDVVAEAGLASASEGEEPRRRVVVLPA